MGGILLEWKGPPGKRGRKDMKARSVLTTIMVLVGAFSPSCQSETDDGGPTVPLGQPRTASGPGQGGTRGDFDPRQVLVQLVPGKSIATINRRYGTQTVGVIESERIYLLRLPSGKNINDLLATMRQDSAIETAEPNYRSENPEAQKSSMTFADPDLD